MKKFRAFCPFNGTMWDCDETDGCTSFNFYFDKDILKAQIWIDKNGEDVGIFDDDWFSPEQHDCIVMQFMNLKGKDGVEIYEGDIVKYPDMKEVTRLTSYHRRPISEKDKESVYRVGEICFIDGSTWVRNNGSMFCLAWAMAYQGSPHDLPLNAQQIEVIGNIHENPELLNKLLTQAEEF